MNKAKNIFFFLFFSRSKADRNRALVHSKLFNQEIPEYPPLQYTLFNTFAIHLPGSPWFGSNNGYSACYSSSLIICEYTSHI